MQLQERRWTHTIMRWRWHSPPAPLLLQAGGADRPGSAAGAGRDGGHGCRHLLLLLAAAVEH